MKELEILVHGFCGESFGMHAPPLQRNEDLIKIFFKKIVHHITFLLYMAFVILKTKSIYYPLEESPETMSKQEMLHMLTITVKKIIHAFTLAI